MNFVDVVKDSHDRYMKWADLGRSKAERVEGGKFREVNGMILAKFLISEVEKSELLFTFASQNPLNY